MLGYHTICLEKLVWSGHYSFTNGTILGLQFEQRILSPTTADRLPRLTALSYDFHAFVDTELTRPDHRVIINIRWEYSISTGVFDNICLFFKTRMNTDFADSFLGWFSIDFLPKCGMSKRISRENEQVCLKILQWNSTIMFFERLCYIANL